MFKQLFEYHTPKVRWRSSLSISVRQRTAGSSRQRSPLARLYKPCIGNSRPVRLPLPISMNHRPRTVDRYETSENRDTTNCRTEQPDTFKPVLPCLMTKNLKYSSSPKLPASPRKRLRSCGNRRRQESFTLTGWEDNHEDLKLVLDLAEIL
jgi:hypothetical protein